MFKNRKCLFVRDFKKDIENDLLITKNVVRYISPSTLTDDSPTFIWVLGVNNNIGGQNYVMYFKRKKSRINRKIW